MSGSPGGLEHNLEGGERAFSASLLGPAESVILQVKPSRWYVLFVSLPVVAAGLGLVLLAFAVRELPYSLRHWMAVLGISAMGLRFALGCLQWYGRTYVLTDRRILTQSGVLNVGVESMGFEEIDACFAAQAAGQRAVGLGTIFFRPAGGYRTHMAWEHIRHSMTIHERIIAEMQRWRRHLADAGKA